jgi:methylmalonyl-CoA/ethylmalonyl-CoA epimerase
LTGASLTFHHVGLACESLAIEVAAHRTLGFREEGAPFEDSTQRIRGQFMVNAGFRVELLEPLGPDSPLAGSLRRGVKMYHQAFLTSKIRESIDALVEDGALLLSAPCSAVAFDGREIAFLILQTALVVELIQM